nr:hypothetical protein [Tanacetum cinerariifolium]
MIKAHDHSLGLLEFRDSPPLIGKIERFFDSETIKHVAETSIRVILVSYRVIDPTYLEDQPNLRETFAAIKFDCLLDINEQICLVFVLEFYKSVRLIQKLNGTLSVAFIIQNVEISLQLGEFARILRVPCQGVCVFTLNLPISSLLNGVDSNPEIYPPSYEDFVLIRDALFYEIPPIKTRKETILSEIFISLTGNKDHPNACLCYMLYCLTIKKPFNLAYYIGKRMERVTKSNIMALLYEMLLTRLFVHVHISHPFSITDNHYIVDHVMIPLSEKQVFRIMPKGKRPYPQTPTLTESFESPSPTPHQEKEEENDLVNNYTLDAIPYID